MLCGYSWQKAGMIFQTRSRIRCRPALETGTAIMQKDAGELCVSRIGHPGIQNAGQRLDSGRDRPHPVLLPRPFGNPTQAQRSGLRGERRNSEMSEFSPQVETRDMELVTTMRGVGNGG